MNRNNSWNNTEHLAVLRIFRRPLFSGGHNVIAELVHSPINNITWQIFHYTVVCVVQQCTSHIPLLTGCGRWLELQCGGVVRLHLHPNSLLMVLGHSHLTVTALEWTLIMNLLILTIYSCIFTLSKNVCKIAIKIFYCPQGFVNINEWHK